MSNHVAPAPDLYLWSNFEAWRSYRWRYLFGAIALESSIGTLVLNKLLFGFSPLNVVVWLIFWPICFLVCLVPTFAAYTIYKSSATAGNTAQNVEKYFNFADKSFANSAFGADRKKTVPMSTLWEAYLDLKVDFNEDLLETLRRRDEFANYQFTFKVAVFFAKHVIPELLSHSRAQDRAQVTDHYDRGNDFFNAFLGETMVYTSAFYKSIQDTLEQAQHQKLDLVCRKLHLKEGEKLLDLGCGWGTLICHAAKYFGVDATGVTLSKEQVQWGTQQAKDMGVADRVRPLVRDYRDAPRQSLYDKISCLEMAEHVGIRNFQSFLQQVYSMLKDDGLFYLQIASIRRSWTWEDLNWAVFMDKYVFPGADASTPIWWVIEELEKAGFEVHSVENVGIHYSKTINAWYNNWKSNKQYILEHYGERWYRQWLWFLGWSTIIAENGTSTAYQIILHKNRNEFDRDFYIGEHKGLGYHRETNENNRTPVKPQQIL